jgi:hypothetical protein
LSHSGNSFLQELLSSDCWGVDTVEDVLTEAAILAPVAVKEHLVNAEFRLFVENLILFLGWIIEFIEGLGLLFLLV